MGPGRGALRLNRLRGAAVAARRCFSEGLGEGDRATLGALSGWRWVAGGVTNPVAASSRLELCREGERALARESRHQPQHASPFQYPAAPEHTSCLPRELAPFEVASCGLRNRRTLLFRGAKPRKHPTAAKRTSHRMT